MSRSPKKPYHHGDLKRALVNTARSLCESEGPSALSFRRLAEATNVSHAAPLAHFPDRLSLNAAVAAEGFRELRAHLAPLAAEPAAHRRRLIEALLSYLRFALERPGLYRAMNAPELSTRLSEPGGQPGVGGRLESPWMELQEQKAAVFRKFLDLVLAGQQAGEFRKDASAERAARLFAALVEGLALRILEEKPGLHGDRLKEAEPLLELALGAIAP